MSEAVKEKQPAGSIQEQLIERREAVEKNREEREKPRKDFLAGKGGKGSDHFDVTTNRETIERYVDQTGAPESVENLSDEPAQAGALSAREVWLRTGELPDKKPNGAAEKKDLQQAEQKNNEQPQGEIDKETFEEFKSERQDFWNEPEHVEAHKTFPDRMVRVIQALTPAEKQVLTNSPVSKMKLHGDLDGYLGHALSRVTNLGRVLVVLNKDIPLLEAVNADYAKTEGNSDERFKVQQKIRFILKYIDKQVAKMSTEQWHGRGATSEGAERKAERQLTRAGKPPIEASGASSSPADDGSSEAAWRRKDLTTEERGELYRERRNKEESDALRRRRRRN